MPERNPSPVPPAADPRVVQALSLVRHAFGTLPADFDPTPLLPFVGDADAPTQLAPLLRCLSRYGCPCSGTLLARWAALAGTSRNIQRLERVLELARPATFKDWTQLLDLFMAGGTPPVLDRLQRLAEDLSQQGRSVDCTILAMLVTELTPPSRIDAFLQALRGFRLQAPTGRELYRLLITHCRDEESASWIGEIGGLLAQRGRTECRVADLELLFTELPTRMAVKRYHRALDLLEAQGIRVNEFDAFVTSFAKSTEDISWLEEAMASLQELGRKVERLTLVQLRDWAPDTSILKRCIRGVHALEGSGLSRPEIESFLLPKLVSEEATMVATMIGELGRLLFDAKLTLEHAERLFGMLPERTMVRRYATVFKLLTEAGMRPVDVEALTPEFIRSRDDVIWLEAFVRNVSEWEQKVNRLELLRIRERCPEVSQLYRYARLRLLLEGLHGLSLSDFEDRFFAAALDDEKAHTLTDWLALCRERRPDIRTPAFLRLMEAFPGRWGASRYTRAIQSFRGKWSTLDAFAIRFATTNARANQLDQIGSILAMRRLNDLDAHPELTRTIEQVLARADHPRAGGNQEDELKR